MPARYTRNCMHGAEGERQNSPFIISSSDTLTTDGLSALGSRRCRFNNSFARLHTSIISGGKLLIPSRLLLLAAPDSSLPLILGAGEGEQTTESIRTRAK